MKRSVIAVALAAVLALLGCVAVLVYVRSADSRALAGKRAVNVLVATKRIPAGTTGARIKAGGYAEVVAMPQSAVPVDAMSTVDTNLDKLAVNVDVQPRQLLLRGSFGAPTATTGGLALPEGRIAVTISAAGTAGGFVRPGAEVAIFDTFTTNANSNVPDGQRLTFGANANQVTRLLLPRVEVIAVGDKTASASNTQQTGEATDQTQQTPATGATLTVAVDQDEAERLVHALQTGTLYFALLDESSDIRSGPGVTNGNLFP
jgi:pilus assembly protein CpaB